MSLINFTGNNTNPVNIPMKDIPLPMQGDLIKPVSVGIDRDYKISEHFTYGTLVLTGQRQFIEKNYEEGKKLIDNMTRLCKEILEPVITLVGVIPNINSCFRCPDLNTAIGASKTSQHMVAEAADTTYPGLSLKKVFNMIMGSKLPYGQLIFEFGSWIHGSIQDPKLYPGKIRQNFVASTINGKTVYTPVTKDLV